MGLEIATYISDLVATNPSTSDPLAQGDDHIRLMKAALKASFPLVIGQLNATMVPFTPAGGIVATTVAGALAELQSSKYEAGEALGTPVSGNLANCTFPTLNQNTTGTAAIATNIADGAVSTAAKIAANVVGVAKLAREGTAGQVLTSNGPGVNPSYKTLAGAGVTSVGGYTGVVSAGQVAAAAVAGWGATPSFPGHTHSYAGTNAVVSIASAELGYPHICTTAAGGTFSFTTTNPAAGACLHPHSRVVTPLGRCCVCDIRPGDSVLTNSGYKTVLGSWESSLGSRQMVSINNGVVVTPGHLFPLSDGTWAAVDTEEYELHDQGKQHPVKTLDGMLVVGANTVQASKLKLGDMLITLSGLVPVTSIDFYELKATGLPVFSLVLEDANSFFSDGISVATLGGVA